MNEADVDTIATAIQEGTSGRVLEGLYLTVFNDSVINLAPRDRELTRDDVDTVRAAIARIGMREVESWLARQGVSWLSDGVFAGVSFRLSAAG